MQGRLAARLGLALLCGVSGTTLAAGAELRAGAGVRIVQAAGISATGHGVELAPDGTASGGFSLTAAPDTAVSFSIEAVPDPGTTMPADKIAHDAGPTPATDGRGSLTVLFEALPGAEAATYRVIVHY